MLGSPSERHVERFYRAFDALQDIEMTRGERPSCRAKYDALLRALKVFGAMRAEYAGITPDFSREGGPREAGLMHQAEDWVYRLTVEFDQRCAKRFR